MNAELTTSPPAAGAWRRLGAFLIDVIALGLAGVSAGYLLFDVFVGLGSWGRLLGFVVALLYFGVLNSRAGNGQTLGKRLLRIKVVGRDGAFLPLPASALRFAVLGTPWFLNGAWFPPAVLSSGLVYLLSAAVFGLGLAILYLFLFNRPTRQSLHDLAVGSRVVASNAVGATPADPLKRAHAITVSVIMVVAAMLPYFAMRLVSREPFTSLMQVYAAVSAEPGVVHAEVNKSWPSSSTGTSYLAVTAFLSDSGINDSARASRLARLAIEADPSAMKMEVVQVTLVYGFDIGLASMRRSRAYGNAPASWVGKPAGQN
jgi:uncharacterized RDD family membrane protein YckC